MKIFLGHNRICVMLSVIFFKILRKLILKLPCIKKPNEDLNLQGCQFTGYVKLWDESANENVYRYLTEKTPCMVSKFGTVELCNLIQYKMSCTSWFSLSDISRFLRREIPSINWIDNDTFSSLCTNAGFFPQDKSLLKQFYNENISAMRQIDILGSYIRNEDYFSVELKNALRVNLDGYYAPFFYKHPWTRCLEGKKILVVHPFAEDIQRQYEKRAFLWDNPEVLPDFELITYKAVQSMLGTKTEFTTWFDALQHMKDDISKIDFDIALIGCGAYGMPLAAYCKSLGKSAVHLAGWTQILFGIIGKRWENNDAVKPYINEYWVHPSQTSRPANAEKVENGCYW